MIVVGETEKCNVKCKVSSESDMSNDLAGVAAREERPVMLRVPRRE